MLSLLPQLLFLSPLGPSLIRFALGITLAYSAWRHVSRADTVLRVFGIVELVTAAAIIVGAWTQGAAIVAVLALLISIFLPRLRVLPKSTALLALVMAITLIMSGAGAIAFDLPL